MGGDIENCQCRLCASGAKHQNAARRFARLPHLIERGAIAPEGNNAPQRRIRETMNEKSLRDAWLQMLNPVTWWDLLTQRMRWGRIGDWVH